jgi:hypothetical protein
VPLLFLIAVVFLVVLIPLVLMPLALVQRYRVGTARRQARGWIATLTLTGLLFSAALFLAGAALMNVWLPRAFLYSVGGLTAGAVLGAFGLWTTRWETRPSALHYTPNRWLVLIITLVVTARLLYGFWRGWQAWQTGLDGGSWLAASGAAGSLAAGALVLGYYLTYWSGVRRRLARFRTRLR